jgi:hypothetical protein
MTLTRRGLLAAMASTVSTAAVGRSAVAPQRAIVWLWLDGGAPTRQLFPGGVACPRLLPRLAQTGVLRIVSPFGHRHTDHDRARHFLWTGSDDPTADCPAKQWTPSLPCRLAKLTSRRHVQYGSIMGNHPGTLGDAFTPETRPHRELSDALSDAITVCAGGAVAACVCLPGWDHHGDKTHQFVECASTLDAAIAAVLPRLGTISLVLTSEFGRCSHTNHHGGTDHDPSHTLLASIGDWQGHPRTPTELHESLTRYILGASG